MLPKHIRLDLRHRPDFFQDAKSIKTENLTGLWREIETPSLRAAIVIKKRTGKTVQRAKIRRILRSVLIELWNENKVLFQKPVGLVLLPRGSVQSFSEYKSQVSMLLQQL